MTDVFDAKTRSRIMRQVRGKNTRPEVAVRRHLHAAGYRYRLHARDLPGTPDLVLPRYRTAVFINGCFWHGHPCQRGKRQPVQNAAYWRDKIRHNRQRDAAARRRLRATGWAAYTVWECAPERGLSRLITHLRRRQTAPLPRP